MLTETATDPRRANWLTITSMAEDVCWPDDGGTRPSWELEAEILRLTTRLMMRERELRQVKGQLKAQTSRAQQQAASWRRRMEEKEEQMRILLVQKDAEMQAIVSQLLLFEAELRQEQSRIETLLHERDAQIRQQQEELDRLHLRAPEVKDREEVDAKCNIQETKVHSKEVQPEQDTLKPRPIITDSTAAVKKLKDGLIRIRAIQDLTNVRSPSLETLSMLGEKGLISDSGCENIIGEKKKIAHRTPQKMKDLKAKRINTHKVHRSVVGEIKMKELLAITAKSEKMALIACKRIGAATQTSLKKLRLFGFTFK